MDGQIGLPGFGRLHAKISELYVPYSSHTIALPSVHNTNRLSTRLFFRTTSCCAGCLLSQHRCLHTLANRQLRALPKTHHVWPQTKVPSLSSQTLRSTAQRPNPTENRYVLVGRPESLSSKPKELSLHHTMATSNNQIPSTKPQPRPEHQMINHPRTHNTKSITS